MASPELSISQHSVQGQLEMRAEVVEDRESVQSSPNLVVHLTENPSDMRNGLLPPGQNQDNLNFEDDKSVVSSSHVPSMNSSPDIHREKRHSQFSKGEIPKLQNEKGEKKEKKVPKYKRDIICLLENKISTILMTAFTVYALFGDDIRLLTAQKQHDDGFYAMACICFVLFTLEIVLASIAKKDYFIGFYFWLDIISTLSLIPDIGWIWDPIIGNQDVNAQNAGQVSSIVSASRGARVGTKAGRVVRIIRLVRLIRIVKLYKHAQNVIEEGADKDKILPLPESTNPRLSESQIGVLDMPSPGPRSDSKNLRDQIRPSLKQSLHQKNISSPSRTQPAMRRSTGTVHTHMSNSRTVIKPVHLRQKEEAKLPQESKVGKKLSDLTTRRVIILVLIMMFSVPLFTLSTYTDVDSNTGFQFGLELIALYGSNPTEKQAARNTYVDQYDNIDTPIILLRTDTQSLDYETSTNPDKLRIVEKEFVTLNNNDSFVAVFDLRTTSKLNAGLGIARTVFICVVLAGGAIFFSKDANDLVIGPIEAMMQKVNKIAENPLVAAQEQENQALIEEISKSHQQEEQVKKKRKGKKKKKQAPFETQILEQTLIKIGALLALGFGEAGSKIIAQNMKATGDVNPMIPGNKIIAIFGFCDIRQFTDTTEILQEDVMLFVNEIAEIVHSIVDHFSGAANKNIGDAFLLVWKFREEDLDTEDQELVLVPCNEVTQIADMSALSFLKIIAKINRSAKLAKYRDYPELKRRMPNYKVRMGFGLHVGWAIEGAIGSDFKIDASYLSPNVNMASRLEAATKQFGTPLLISGQLYNLFSEITKRYMRQIDRVTVKGSIKPLNLYTCDMDINKIQLDREEDVPLSRQEKKRFKVRGRLIRDRMRENAFSRAAPISALFETDEDFKNTIGTYPLEFYQAFTQGFQHYLEGQWIQAREEFSKIKDLKGEIDYPTQNLLNVMGEKNFEAPNDWQGYRALTEK